MDDILTAIHVKVEKTSRLAPRNFLPRLWAYQAKVPAAERSMWAPGRRIIKPGASPTSL